MNIYSIYKATNQKSGKVYIGYTNNFKNRIKDHKKNFKKHKSKFYDAIKSYGWDSFTWEVIYQSTDSKHCLSVMEPHFISEYQSMTEGYNMTSGGEGISNDRIDDTVRQKLAIAGKNRWLNGTNGNSFREKVECPHCGKIGTLAIMKRWHFDKCKLVIT